MIWTKFSDADPIRSGHIWLSDGNQVVIAYWSMERTPRYSDTPSPGVTWHHMWLGTEEPTHWCYADRPAPPDQAMIDAALK